MFVSEIAISNIAVFVVFALIILGARSLHAQSVDKLRSPLIYVTDAGKVGIYDTAKKVFVLEPKFDRVYSAGPNLVGVKGDQYYIATEECYNLHGPFDQIFSSGYGYICAGVNGRSVVISISSRGMDEIYTFNYKKMETISEIGGLLMVTRFDGKNSILNISNQKTLLPFASYKIMEVKKRGSFYSLGSISLMTGDMMILLQISAGDNGCEISISSSKKSFSIIRVIPASKYAITYKDGKFGLINIQGQVVVPHDYDYYYYIEGGDDIIFKSLAHNTPDKELAFNSKKTKPICPIFYQGK